MGTSIAQRKSLKGGANKPASKAKLGSGGRFAALTKQIGHKSGVRNPAAVAAAIGRSKYGGKKMAKMAAHGRAK
jgi:hypothetical protein